jgi:integrase
MPKFDIQRAIQATNDRLKDAAVAPRIRLNGQKLTIRASLPGLGQKEFSLGISANRDGLKEAERKCHQLDRELSTGTFTRENWERKRKLKPHELPTAELIETFRVEYMRSHKISAETWKQNWIGTFKHLPQNAPLTDAAILAVVYSKENHSCARKRACQRLQVLADYAGIQLDLSSYSGTYGESRLQPRDIPSDELILEWRDLVPNDRWQWFYGMLATFGLRPHEVFYCEFIEPHKLLVNDGKTKDRFTYAILPEWVDLWNLTEIKRPNVTGKTFSDYGRRSQRTFHRYQMPFPCYALRHAYAIRGTVRMRLDAVSMAKYMGHSVKVHTQTYQRWIDAETVERQYEEHVLNRPQTPL